MLRDFFDVAATPPVQEGQCPVPHFIHAFIGKFLFQNLPRRLRDFVSFRISGLVAEHIKLPQRFMFLFQYTDFVIVAAG